MAKLTFVRSPEHKPVYGMIWYGMVNKVKNYMVK